jgi:microsomal dipeptidase-like Zn-dependent dipeptidase
MKKSKLLPAMLLWAVIAHGQTAAFRHIAARATIGGHVTIINNPAVNSRPEMILITTDDYGTAGPYRNAATGVWFADGRWKIFNQNTATPMPENARFNVLAVTPGANAFIHTAAAGTLSGHITIIDNPALNNQPNARILITQNWGTGGPYNNHPVGVYYDGGRWKIFNQDYAAMPVNAKFNVYIDSRTFDVGAGSGSANWFRFSNTATDGQPGALLFTTQYWTGVYNPNETGVWYNATGWTIYNQNLRAMPSGARFNVLPLTGTATPAGMTGWVDMHTHPMSNFGFGKQFFFGNADGDPAVSLGSCGCIHNFVVPPFDGSCGEQNLIRNKLIDELDPHTKSSGFPDFNNYPAQNTTTHQQMWWEWLDRARRGGLRSIVALAQNSHTMADGMETAGPYDDMRSMNEQIRELINFVRRHTDIMDTVTNAARMRQVASTGRLAVIIGIEMDNIGNFYKPAEQRPGETYKEAPSELDMMNELDRLYTLGVRYIFPVHITNNVIGGASLYGSGDMEPVLFNLSNRYNTGIAFVPEVVATSTTGIGFKLPRPDELGELALLGILGTTPLRPLPEPVMQLAQYGYTSPGAGFGHRNSLGLTQLGERAIRYMMRKGFMIDIDHMSEKCVSRVMQIAWENNYPLNSGHNGPRAGSTASEKERTVGHYDTLRRLGGMVGVGTGDAEASGFLSTFRTVLGSMGGSNVAIGTDVHVGAKLPQRPSAAARLIANVPGLEVCCNTGSSSKRWDFNSYNNNGVSHYGLMPEFIQSVRNAGMTTAESDAFNSSAEFFTRMWERTETRAASLTTPVTFSTTITPAAIGSLCPFNLVAGDREFGGHGPQVTGDATLRISADGSRLELVVNFTARETTSDWSEVRGNFVVQVGAAAPAGQRYIRINSATTSTFNQVLVGGGRNEVFEGCDGGEHTVTSSGGLISRLTVVGDTGGNDISNDADCNCDTRITGIVLNTINVTLGPR